jgi:aryl-alcohol dehydrogenase-like predicted oxidoreductase
MLGEALKGIPREEYCLVGIVGHDIYEGLRQGSKGYPRFTDPTLRGPDKYYDYLKMAAEKSLERCQTSKFDLPPAAQPGQHRLHEREVVWDAITALKNGRSRPTASASPPDRQTASRST